MRQLNYFVVIPSLDVVDMRGVRDCVAGVLEFGVVVDGLLAELMTRLTLPSTERHWHWQARHKAAGGRASRLTRQGDAA